MIYQLIKVIFIYTIRIQFFIIRGHSFSPRKLFPGKPVQFWNCAAISTTANVTINLLLQLGGCFFYSTFIQLLLLFYSRILHLIVNLPVCIRKVQLHTLFHGVCAFACKRNIVHWTMGDMHLWLGC